MTIVRWAALVIGALSCVAIPAMPSASDEIVLIRDRDFGADREFLLELIETVRRETPVMNFAEHNVSVGRVDLDGDGAYELIVVFHHTYFCGNSNWCGAYLYRRTASGWQYFGNSGPAVEDSKRFGNYHLFVKNERHRGWRILHNGEVQMCWTDNPTLGEYSYSYRTFGGKAMGPGLFRGIELGKPCPDPLNF